MTKPFIFWISPFRRKWVTVGGAISERSVVGITFAQKQPALKMFETVSNLCLIGGIITCFQLCLRRAANKMAI